MAINSTQSTLMGNKIILKSQRTLFKKKIDDKLFLHNGWLTKGVEPYIQLGQFAPSQMSNML